MIKFTPLLDTLRLEKISDSVYFSEKYSYYISNSRLSFINPEQEGSCKKFLDGFKANRLFIPSLPLGSAVHEIMLQPELFELDSKITNKPTAKAGFIADEIISMINKSKDKNISDKLILEACKIVDYYKGCPNETQFDKLKNQIIPYIKDRLDYESKTQFSKEPIYLDTKQMSIAKSCIEALQNNKKVMSLLHPDGIIENPISENEQTILLDVEVELSNSDKFIIRLKAKLDNYTIDTENNIITVNDIKTHGKIIPEFLNSIDKYHYYREITMYSYLLNLCANKFYNMNNPKWKGNFLVVSTIPQYYTKVFPMTKKLFNKGFEEFKYLLKLAALTLHFKDEEKVKEYARNEI